MNPQPNPITPFPVNGADYDALRNDLEQASQLAADFQHELAGKSNESAELKRELQKTRNEFAILQSALGEMRRKNDRLIQQGTPAERKFVDIVAERDRLRLEVEALRQGLASSADEMIRNAREKEARIVQLEVAVESLKHRLATALGTPGVRIEAPAPDAAVLAALGKISESLASLQSAVERGATKAPAEEAEEFVDISF